jgi:hypothetical protein
LPDKGKRSRKPSIARRSSNLKELNFGFGNEFNPNLIFESVIRNDLQQLRD